jgi:hypothetical protein
MLVSKELGPERDCLHVGFPMEFCYERVSRNRDETNFVEFCVTRNGLFGITKRNKTKRIDTKKYHLPLRLSPLSFSRGSRIRRNSDETAVSSVPSSFIFREIIFWLGIGNPTSMSHSTVYVCTAHGSLLQPLPSASSELANWILQICLQNMHTDFFYIFTEYVSTYRTLGNHGYICTVHVCK